MKTHVMLSLDTVLASEMKALSDALGAPLSEVADVALGYVLKLDRSKLAAALASRRAQRQNSRPFTKGELALIAGFKRLVAKGSGFSWQFGFKDVFGEAGLRPRDGWAPLRSLEARGLVREYHPIDPGPTDEQGRPTAASFALVECIPLGHTASRKGLVNPDAPMAECDKPEYREAWLVKAAARSAELERVYAREKALQDATGLPLSVIRNSPMDSKAIKEMIAAHATPAVVASE